MRFWIWRQNRLPDPQKKKKKKKSGEKQRAQRVAGPLVMTGKSSAPPGSLRGPVMMGEPPAPPGSPRVFRPVMLNPMRVTPSPSAGTWLPTPCPCRLLPTGLRLPLGRGAYRKHVPRRPNDSSHALWEWVLLLLYGRDSNSRMSLLRV